MRKAASMIELVIAIVVMGIAMMTLPMMLTTVQSNNTFAMQQEAILIARTQMGDIITYPWDEYSTNSNSDFAVLDTNSSDLTSSIYKRSPDQNSTRRVGHVKGNKRRKFFSTKVYASYPLGQEGTEYDDIDDFNDENKGLSNDANDTNATIGYKVYKDLNMTISVKYISDINSTVIFDFNQTSAPIGTTNIKMIQVSLTNSQLDGNISLRAFSCNIGANQLLRRTF